MERNEGPKEEGKLEISFDYDSSNLMVTNLLQTT